MNISELYRALGPIETPTRPDPKTPLTPQEKTEFSKALQQEELQLSQHAETRIKSRAIPWTEALQKRISEGLDAAQAKGSREALILADDVAVIANVKSRTIVTAMDRAQLKERVFTNIDSAVLV